MIAEKAYRNSGVVHIRRGSSTQGVCRTSWYTGFLTDVWQDLPELTLAQGTLAESLCVPERAILLKALHFRSTNQYTGTPGL